MYIRFQVHFAFVLLLLCLRIYHKKTLPLLLFLVFLYYHFYFVVIVLLVYQYRFTLPPLFYLKPSCIFSGCSLNALNTGLKSKFIAKLPLPFLFFKHTSCTSLGIFFLASRISSFVGCLLLSLNNFSCNVKSTSAVYSMPSALFKRLKTCRLCVVHTIKRTYTDNGYMIITANFL